MPAHVGELQLVPPYCCSSPLRKTTPPVSGSAASATSGTSRFDPAGTPGPVCQSGREKNWLTPPPPLNQALSLLTTPVGISRFRVVPPTAVTFGSFAGAPTCSGPEWSP